MQSLACEIACRWCWPSHITHRCNPWHAWLPAGGAGQGVECSRAGCHREPEDGGICKPRLPRAGLGYGRRRRQRWHQVGDAGAAAAV
eukprot:1161968-Pelagomonas_calceolata.AAC.4